MTGRHVSSLRVALASHQPARGKRYSPGLKARVIEFAQSRRGEGASWEQISGDLGVALETARRWCLAAEVEPVRALRLARSRPDVSGGVCLRDVVGNGVRPAIGSQAKGTTRGLL
jgi:hypothetical protein